MNRAISCCGTVEPFEGILDATISQENIGPLYDKIAGVYDVWGYLTESRARKRALELAGIVNGQSIVEVACGTGLAFVEIVKRNPGGINTGVDISDGMLKKARQRLGNYSHSSYTLVKGTAFSLPFEDGSVDTLINNYMFDLMSGEDMGRVIREFKRILKKEGKLVLANMTTGNSFVSKVYDRIYTLSPKTMGGCRGVQMSEKLKDNGFQIVTMEYVQQLLFPSEVILAIK